MKCGIHGTVMFRDMYKVGIHYYCPRCAMEGIKKLQTEQAEASSLSALLVCEKVEK